MPGVNDNSLDLLRQLDPDGTRECESMIKRMLEEPKLDHQRELAEHAAALKRKIQLEEFEERLIRERKRQRGAA